MPRVREIEVAVGTRNALKVAAARRALRRLGVRARVAGVTVRFPDLPRGLSAIIAGAKSRARRARKHGPVGVGIEAGLWRVGGATLIACATAVYDGRSMSIGFGPAFAAPGRLPRGSRGGAVALVSGGRVRRAEILESAVVMAWLGRRSSR